MLQGGPVAHHCGIDGASPLARARLRGHGNTAGPGTAVTQRVANHTVAVRFGWRWAWVCPSSRCGKLQTGQSAPMPSRTVSISVNGATVAASNVRCPVISPLPGHNLTKRAGDTSLQTPLAPPSNAVGGAVQSNKVYLPQEVLLVSADLASRQINAIRYAFNRARGS